MDSPYAPPAATPELSPSGGFPLTARPGVIAVFGVLHFVFFGIGVLFALSSLFSIALATTRPFHDLRQPLWIAAVTTGISVITATLIFIAGLGLVRNRRNAIRASNRYAITAICGKIISVPLSLLHLYDRISPNLKTPGATVGVVFVFFLYLAISCIYPILCLTLLNRPRIKDWLAANGT